MRDFPRRTFLKAGALAGMATALGAHGEPVTSKTAVRVGLVGTGNRGMALLSALLQIPDVEVRAVCDLVGERAGRAQDEAEKAGQSRPDAYVKGEREYERLVARDDLDAVICATTWQWHTPVMVSAMRAGKYGATEVPAAQTLEECWQLVAVSEETGMPCMMLENVCYFREMLALLRMVREGVFGELLHAEAGYQHDCRFLLLDDQGLTWRGQVCADMNGNQYPTHPIGPIAQWFNINRGDRFTRLVSMSSPARGLKAAAVKQFGADHPLGRREYAQGDINTCLIQTEKGLSVTLYYDMLTPRPYEPIFRLQGTRGIHAGGQIYLEDVSPEKDKYEAFEPYLEKYAHPLWTGLEKEAAKNGGHGGSDYITMYEFIRAVRNKTQTPQDVYDAATWSALVPLSMKSIAQASATVDFPDFTGGKWNQRAPLDIGGI